MAQLVQHLPRTQNIAGSSPTRGSSSFSLGKKRVVFGCRCLHLPCLYNLLYMYFLHLSSHILHLPPSLISLLPSSSLLPTELSSRGARDEIVDILQLEPPPYCLPKDSNPPLSSFLPPSLESHFKVREKTSWRKRRGWRGEGGCQTVKTISCALTSTASSMEFIVLSALLIRPRKVLQLILIGLSLLPFFFHMYIVNFSVHLPLLLLSLPSLPPSPPTLPPFPPPHLLVLLQPLPIE